MSSRKRRPSGPTQPETERKARQRLLRLLPAVHRELDRLAARRGLTASGYVSALVMADASGSTWQWRPTAPDTAFAPPFGTIRQCQVCGAALDEAEEFIGRAGESKRMVEAARRILSSVAESMTEHAYQEMASALESPPRIADRTAGFDRPGREHTVGDAIGLRRDR